MTSPDNQPGWYSASQRAGGTCRFHAGPFCSDSTSLRSIVANSVLLGNELPALQTGLIVVFVLVGALGQIDLLPLYLFVRDGVENVRNAIQPGAPLVVRPHDEPWRMFGVGPLQHLIACFGVFVPSFIRLDIHRAQFPLAKRIIDPG